MSIFEFFAQATFILAFAGVVNAMLGRASASVRHLVWVAAGIALLLLPIASLTLPTLRIPIGTALRVSAPPLFTTTVAITQSSQIATVVAPPVPGAMAIRWLTVIWSIGTALAFARMLAAWLAVRNLRRNALPFRGEELVRIAPHCRMPMTCGVWNTVVYLPVEAVHWPEDRLNSVLEHEFAHIRRRDVASRLFLRTVLNLHWWNPLAWLAWRQFLREGESAADDLVLLAGIKPSAYAEQLLTVARQGEGKFAEDWAAVAMARPAALETRLQAILDPTTNRRPPARTTMATAVLCAFVAALPVATVRAQDSPRSSQDATGALALVKHGDEARDRGQLDEAKRFYEQAAAIGSGPGPAAALLQLALAAKAASHPGQAADFLQRALTADSNGAQAGPTQTWMAEMRREAGDEVEAKALFLRSLGLDQPQSPQKATTSELYARMLRQQDRVEEAKLLEDDAKIIRTARVEELSPKISASPLHTGADVLPPKLLDKVEPTYSAEGRAARWQGTVSVQMTVAEDGKAYNMHLAKSLGLGLDEAAIAAIGQWRFTPATRNGSSVSVVATVEVNFRLL
jgi:TonB family protein